MPGVIYAINDADISQSGRPIARDTSSLYWYQHLGWADGSDHWRTAGPLSGPPGLSPPRNLGIGGGLTTMQHVFSGAGGILYTVDPAGLLHWFRHLGCLDGTDRWQATPDPKGHIGEGWGMKHVFAGEDGVIYAVNQQNQLLWYRHLGFADGTDRWQTTPDPKGYIGEGWDMKRVFAGAEGVIYAVNQQNQLLWYRHLGYADGTDRWQTTPDPKGYIGESWDMQHVFAGEGGIIYAVNQQSQLLWYRHLGHSDGTDRWQTTPDPKGYIGEGWTPKFAFHFMPSRQAGQAAIATAFKAHNGVYGRLASATGPVLLQEDASYTQAFRLGTITIEDATPGVQGSPVDFYNVRADLAAVKCFGTLANAPDNSDALYAIISLVPFGTSSITDAGVAKATTFKTAIVDTHQHDVVLKNTPIGTSIVSGGGAYIVLSLWQHKQGDPDKIRDHIHQGLNDLINKASDLASAMAGDPTDTGGAQTTGGGVGDITNQKIAGWSINDITNGLADDITNAFFADRLIDSHVYNVYLDDVIRLSTQDGVTASEYHDPDIDQDIRVNWPPNAPANPLLGKNGASYKAYFTITAQHFHGDPAPVV
jgi:hypothetical protein